MTRKQVNRILIAFFSFVAVFLISFLTYAEGMSYYVCFSYENYSVKNSNKMTGVDEDSDGVFDYYVLANKQVLSTTEFYVISSDETKYYSSDSGNMKIDEDDPYRYTIYFNPNGIYDEARTSGTDLAITNCSISYMHYIPGNFTLEIDGVIYSNFKYNPYITTYDAYILPEVSVADSKTIIVHDIDNAYDYTTTVETGGNYRIVFTPTVVRSSNQYRFNQDGEYGTGDDYAYNFYITDCEYYYISLLEDVPYKGATTTITYESQGYTLFRLEKDETKPLQNVFKTKEYFNTEKHTYSYKIFHYSYIFDKYEEIDLDEDKDEQEKKLENVSWYSSTLGIENGKYQLSFIEKTQDFGGYYLIGEFNHYGYTNSGELNLDSKYELTVVDETSAYYDEKNKQYLLADFVVDAAMMDMDSLAFEYYISNGKTKTNKISISTVGTYDILYSNEKTYNDRNYKYIRTSNALDTYTVYEINSVEDFLSFVDDWNLDSESSKYCIYQLNRDLDFAGIAIPSIQVFHGVFYGNGHTLKNISFYDDNGISNISLFSLVTKYATISDLTIENITIDAEDSKYVGFIGRNYGLLENITISGAIVGKEYVGSLVGYNGNYETDSETTSDSSIKYGFGVLKSIESSAKVCGKINVGGISGYNGGKIISSVNTGEVNRKSYASSVTVTNVGGISGYSTGAILDCQNTSTIGYSATGSNVGGISGLCNGEVYYSSNEAKIYGKSYVGGIVGYYGTVSDDKKDNTLSMNPKDYLDKEETPSFTEEKSVLKNRMYYSYNLGDIHATSRVGGIVGYVNNEALEIKNSISKASIFADSGSYAGGIIGYMNNGSVTSSLALGYVEANGSVNKYVGGICGYANGSIIASMANVALNGNEYVGGIAGYLTSSATMESCFANAYLITKSSSHHLGNICGFVEGTNEAAGTCGDKLKYNYFLGSDLKDYSGIDGIMYGKQSHYAASRLFFSTISNENVLDVVSDSFGLIDEEENTHYYETKNSTVCVLSNFYTLEELEDDKFDDDNDYYLDYATYFDEHKDTYGKIMEEASKLVVRLVFKEWDEELDDFKEDNFKVTEIVTVDYESSLDSISLPSFQYAENNKTKRKDSLYQVSWEALKNTNSNQTIYATYKKLVNSVSSLDGTVFVEGEFYEGSTLTVSVHDNEYTVSMNSNSSPVTMKVKVDKPRQSTVYINGKAVESTIYGDYLVFSVDNPNVTFKIVEGPYTYNLYPNYLKALILIVPLFILFVVLIFVSNFRKESNEKLALELEEEKHEESLMEISDTIEDEEEIIESNKALEEDKQKE